MPEPGFIVLHGNRLEDLRDVVIGWMREHPLPPWHDETILVQSNGIAQWLKIALARPVVDGGLGISAGVGIELPARFLWRAYRQVLGDGIVRDHSPYAKDRLGWRILRLLPSLLHEPVMAPVARYTTDDPDWRKRHALAVRVADLFDGYQVYRADWLADWEAGRDVLRDDLRHPGSPHPVPADQCWQPALWRATRADLGNDDVAGIQAHHRGAVHRAFCERIDAAAGEMPGIPPRIIVFGMSSLPQQSVEALAALSRTSQVILAVLNPCRHYWADIIEARELLRAPRRRQAAKPGMPLLPRFEDLHQHANPLLAAWGRQGRDFIRLLDEFDDPDSYRAHFETAGKRIDLFQPATGNRLLDALQGAILDLAPLPPRELRATLAPDDDSIQFHACHSAQREVEVLHDQLLLRFDAAAAAGTPLDPRDVIVMVPDIETYAPVIEAVFGGHDVDDRRHIPFTIADRTARRSDPVVMAAEFLLTLPESRLPVSAVLDFLDVPAVAARFGIARSAMPMLRGWIEGVGIRWGLDAAHRDAQGVPVGEQNSWIFGLHRMLLGYVGGSAVALDGIEPYDEIGGLDAELVGGLADFLDALASALPMLQREHTPSDWHALLRDTLAAFLAPTSDTEQLALERIRQAATDWSAACHEAGLVTALPLNVVREAVLAGLDQVRISQRFMGGAVSFATLMPMRAIPFRVVAMLGMNDGDYPRARNDSDFDLMALPGSSRPGDRSRRDDDRYLFLEALLSARDCLYIGWCGRSARDNTARPPSVLVGQLRDYIAAGWQLDQTTSQTLLDHLTTEHPLQPFSQRYFRAPSPRHPTYAHEWFEAWSAPHSDRSDTLAWELPTLVDGRQLAAFLRHPVKAFFNQRLGVHFDAREEATADHEPFALSGLDRYHLAGTVIRSALADRTRAPAAAVTVAAARLRRGGAFPIATLGLLCEQEVVDACMEVVARYRAKFDETEAVRDSLAPVSIGQTRIDCNGSDLRRAADGSLLRLVWSPNAIVDDGTIRHDRLLDLWVGHLLAHAAGCGVLTQVVAPGADVVLHPLPVGTDPAARLAPLLDAYRDGMRAPLPLARRTALAWLRKIEKGTEQARNAAAAAYDGSGFGGMPGEGSDAYLARAFPDFDAFEAAGFVERVALLAPLLDAAEICT
jgi:exodeoxyribonuclease V gamma subunit